MKSRGLRKTVALFTLLVFLGSLLPCPCFAETGPGSHHKAAKNQTGNHDCCDSDASKDTGNSKPSPKQDNCCCSGCNVYIGVSPSDFSANVSLITDHFKSGLFLLVHNFSDFQFSKSAFLPRGSPPTRISTSESPTTLASKLCRWLI